MYILNSKQLAFEWKAPKKQLKEAQYSVGKSDMSLSSLVENEESVFDTPNYSQVQMTLRDYHNGVGITMSDAYSEAPSSMFRNFEESCNHIVKRKQGKSFFSKGLDDDEESEIELTKRHVRKILIVDDQIFNI
mmetsp:Transcript_11648/g.17681  ORF Transcript_11648/g.17681 Transcript_11648/m.17681 type:complete len:133 (+) Transcript_11648:2218-2616(+)|eukprot:CAMPEP_0170480836 /NCGR_PEP_ID=MMETSP0208-20121228/1516_1 /TAXON_ID=197538 /ORGANISM="Strombidium inclinatum, Strain S3" /LENGTH=132 /DNA_ID=CAMNT_0010753439 /DNA_START=2188 /DNA_END=2586 /DNA_ORIENTATION=-